MSNIKWISLTFFPANSISKLIDWIVIINGLILIWKAIFCECVDTISDFLFPFTTIQRAFHSINKMYPSEKYKNPIDYFYLATKYRHTHIIQFNGLSWYLHQSHPFFLAPEIKWIIFRFIVFRLCAQSLLHGSVVQFNN